MKFDAYSVNDFVTDEDFIKWVKEPEVEDHRFWQDWIRKNPHKKEIIDEARQIVLFLSQQNPDVSDHEFSEAKKSLFDKIHEDRQMQPLPKHVHFHVEENKRSVQRNINFTYQKYAAVFMGLLLLSSVLYITYFSKQHTEYTTAYGETMSILLPDSSTVVLNSNSTLKIGTSWSNNKDREIWLEGEAFFYVIKKYTSVGTPSGQNENIKFIVHANNLEVEVIGTSFNVNNRRDLVKVVLNSGQIKLKARNENIAMLPGDMVEFSPSKEIYTKKSVEAEKYTSWRHKQLIFEDAPISEIAQIIEDNYGLKVEFRDMSLAKRHFTGALPYQDLDLLITVLAESFNLKITKTSEKIIIDKK